MAAHVSGGAARASLDSLGCELGAFLDHVRRETRVPGIAAAVSVEGERVHAAAGSLALEDDAPLTKHTRFHLGCVTKLVVSIVALELVRRGTLHLDVPIQTYLPELCGSIHGETVTLAHLLSHTSGYRGTSIHERGTLAMDWAAFAQWLRRAPQHFGPGTVFSYEHTETVVADRIVQRVTGRSSLAQAEDLIFERLGLAAGRELERRSPAGGRAPSLEWGGEAGQHVLDAASGGFRRVEWSELAGIEVASMWEAAFSRRSMSLDALLALAEFIMAQGPGPAPCSLPAATLTLLQRPAVTLPPLLCGPLAETVPSRFGFGVARWKDGFHGIGGSTFGQCLGLRFDARQGVAVAVGMNALQPYLRDLVIGRICEALAGGFSEEPAQAAPEWDLRELEGEYFGPGTDRVTAAFAEGRLELVVESAAAPLKLRAELWRHADGAIVLDSAAPQLSVGFFRTPDGAGMGLMLGVYAYKRGA